jgi:hypothetical protein
MFTSVAARVDPGDRHRFGKPVRYLLKRSTEDRMGSVVRLLGFTTLGCGCLVGRYRELATNRDVNYVEEKGESCRTHAHRRNHTITERVSGTTVLSAVRTA